MLQADQQFDKAIGFYDRAATLDQNGDPLIALGKGQCLVMLKRYADAYPHIQEA